MKKYANILRSCALFVFLCVLDRITKYYALNHWVDAQIINQFLSFELTFNRGITGGIFHTQNSFGFVLLSICIVCIILLLEVHTYRRFQHGNVVFGEIFVLSGAVSNLIDRVLFGGVIDFIALSWQSWHFPVFNIADMCIVCGVMLMFVTHLWE